MFTIYLWRKVRQKDRLQICLKTDYNDKGVYVARYIKYRGLRKWAVWSLGYWRSFLIGINSFFSRYITSYWSFSVVRWRKTRQIWTAIVKLTLYSCFVPCFVPCFSSTVWFIIVSVMYAQLALPIFPVSRIRVYMHGNISAQWYISASWMRIQCSIWHCKRFWYVPQIRKFRMFKYNTW